MRHCERIFPCAFLNIQFPDAARGNGLGGWGLTRRFLFNRPQNNLFQAINLRLREERQRIKWKLRQMRKDKVICENNDYEDERWGDGRTFFQ